MAVTFGICTCFWALDGVIAAYSSLIGGAIFALPQLYFGYKAYQYQGARSSLQIVQNFYKGESGKIILIASGFAIAFALVKPIDFFALYSTFIAILLMNVIIPVLTEGKSR